MIGDGLSVADARSADIDRLLQLLTDTQPRLPELAREMLGILAAHCARPLLASAPLRQNCWLGIARMRSAVGWRQSRSGRQGAPWQHIEAR